MACFVMEGQWNGAWIIAWIAAWIIAWNAAWIDAWNGAWIVEWIEAWIFAWIEAWIDAWIRGRMARIWRAISVTIRVNIWCYIWDAMRNIARSAILNSSACYGLCFAIRVPIKALPERQR